MLSGKCLFVEADEDDKTAEENEETGNEIDNPEPPQLESIFIKVDSACDEQKP